jgi:hypothetical protein
MDATTTLTLMAALLAVGIGARMTLLVGPKLWLALLLSRLPSRKASFLVPPLCLLGRCQSRRLRSRGWP